MAAARAVPDHGLVSITGDLQELETGLETSTPQLSPLVTGVVVLGAVLAFVLVTAYLVVPADHIPAPLPGVPRTPGWAHRYKQAAVALLFGFAFVFVVYIRLRIHRAESARARAADEVRDLVRTIEGTSARRIPSDLW
jgi:hypothetical protein